MIREAIIALVDERRDLYEEEAAVVMHEIMAGEATEAQMGAFLVALRLKGETADEIAGLARVMRQNALPVTIPERPLLDTAGTGGSKKVFNASTAAAFVAAAGGAKVAKHGNRAMSSQSGAADFLEAMGAKIALGPEQVAECVKRTGVGFMFAQTYHPAMKHVANARREVGVRTVFNILGPLSNPAGANCHVMGAATVDVAEKLADVLGRFGMRHALVVTGDDGLDDISVSGPTTVFEVRGGVVSQWRTSPAELGVSLHPTEAIEGGTPEENARLMREVFAGEGPMAIRDLIAVNAAAGLYVTGLAASLRQGVETAKELIDSGDAAARAGSFVEATRRLAASK